MAAGIESLVARFASHVIKKCAAFSAHLVFLPFGRHVEVLASENTENGLWETICTGEKETVLKPHYQALCLRTMDNRFLMV
jgi:hypothetical protein